MQSREYIDIVHNQLLPLMDPNLISYVKKLEYLRSLFISRDGITLGTSTFYRYITGSHFVERSDYVKENDKPKIKKNRVRHYIDRTAIISDKKA